MYCSYAIIIDCICKYSDYSPKAFKFWQETMLMIELQVLPFSYGRRKQWRWICSCGSSLRSSELRTNDSFKSRNRLRILFDTYAFAFLSLVGMAFVCVDIPLQNYRISFLWESDPPLGFVIWMACHLLLECSSICYWYPLGHSWCSQRANNVIHLNLILRCSFLLFLCFNHNSSCPYGKNKGFLMPYNTENL